MKQVTFPTFGRVTSAYQVSRLRSTVAAPAVKQNSSEISEQWDQARPTEGKFKMIRNFMPGGKYYKKDFMPLTAAIEKDYGDIFLWPATPGRRPMVVTHNPADIECVFRNEGICGPQGRVPK